MNSYQRGFMNKCAEYGVDPRHLVKHATGNVDIATSSVGHALIPGFSIGTLPGMIAGYVDDTDEKRTKKRNTNRPGSTFMNLLPGVGAYRLAQRQKVSAQNTLKRDPSKHPYWNIVSEHISPLTSGLATAGTGAALGALLAKDRGKGALVGATAGAGASALAFVAGQLAGMVKRRRTEKEQDDTETTGRGWAKLLVPGLGNYDNARRNRHSDLYMG